MSLSRHPDEAFPRGMYIAVVEQRDEARAERDAYRDAFVDVYRCWVGRRRGLEIDRLTEIEQLGRKAGA